MKAFLFKGGEEGLFNNITSSSSNFKAEKNEKEKHIQKLVKREARRNIEKSDRNDR